MTEKDAFFQRQMLKCERAWNTGAAEAVYDAMNECVRFNRAPPTWLLKAVETLARRDVRDKPTRRQDMVHFERWDAVRELRDRKGEPGIPNTWEECYERVSEYFQGTPAAGSPETIRASYKLVRKNMEEGRASRYYVPGKKLG